MTWTVASVLVVSGLLVLTVHAMRAADAPTSRPPDLVVVGHQWWWEVRYPGVRRRHGERDRTCRSAPTWSCGSSRPTSSTTSGCPGSPGRWTWCPAIRNTVWLRADRPGTYQGECAEYCGAEHAWMRFLVVAADRGRLRRLAGAPARAAPAPASDAAARGQRVFESKMCASCHAIGGTPARGARRSRPDARREPAAAGRRSRREHAGRLARWLRRPSAMKPGVHMPDLGLSQTQLSDLVSYLRRCNERIHLDRGRAGRVGAGRRGPRPARRGSRRWTTSASASCTS